MGRRDTEIEIEVAMKAAVEDKAVKEQAFVGVEDEPVREHLDAAVKSTRRSRSLVRTTTVRSGRSRGDARSVSVHSVDTDLNSRLGKLSGIDFSQTSLYAVLHKILLKKYLNLRTHRIHETPDLDSFKAKIAKHIKENFTKYIHDLALEISEVALKKRKNRFLGEFNNKVKEFIRLNRLGTMLSKDSEKSKAAKKVIEFLTPELVELYVHFVEMENSPVSDLELRAIVQLYETNIMLFEDSLRITITHDPRWPHFYLHKRPSGFYRQIESIDSLQHLLEPKRPVLIPNGDRGSYPFVALSPQLTGRVEDGPPPLIEPEAPANMAEQEIQYNEAELALIRKLHVHAIEALTKEGLSLERLKEAVPDSFTLNRTKFQMSRLIQESLLKQRVLLSRMNLLREKKLLLEILRRGLVASPAETASGLINDLEDVKKPFLDAIEKEIEAECVGIQKEYMSNRDGWVDELHGSGKISTPKTVDAEFSLARFMEKHRLALRENFNSLQKALEAWPKKGALTQAAQIKFAYAEEVAIDLELSLLDEEVFHEKDKRDNSDNGLSVQFLDAIDQQKAGIEARFNIMKLGGPDLGAIYPDRPIVQGLKYQSIPGDGHCLFHAVAVYLGQDQAGLRQAVAAYIEDRLDEFRTIVEALCPGRSIEQYLMDLRSGAEWADNLEIMVLMKMLNRPIVVIGPDGSIRNAIDLRGVKGEPIFVHYNGYSHYDVYLLRAEWHERAREILASLMDSVEQPPVDVDPAPLNGAGLFAVPRDRGAASAFENRTPPSKLKQTNASWEGFLASAYPGVRPSVIRHILENGLPANMINEEGNTLLHIVLDNELKFYGPVLKEIADYLIRRGASVCVENLDKRSPAAFLVTKTYLGADQRLLAAAETAREIFGLCTQANAFEQQEETLIALIDRFVVDMTGHLEDYSKLSEERKQLFWFSMLQSNRMSTQRAEQAKCLREFVDKLKTSRYQAIEVIEHILNKSKSAWWGLLQGSRLHRPVVAAAEGVKKAYWYRRANLTLAAVRHDFWDIMKAQWEQGHDFQLRRVQEKMAQQEGEHKAELERRIAEVREEGRVDTDRKVAEVKEQSRAELAEVKEQSRVDTDRKVAEVKEQSRADVLRLCAALNIDPAVLDHGAERVEAPEDAVRGPRR